MNLGRTIRTITLSGAALAAFFICFGGGAFESRLCK